MYKKKTWTRNFGFKIRKMLICKQLISLVTTNTLDGIMRCCWSNQERRQKKKYLMFGLLVKSEVFWAKNFPAPLGIFTTSI